MQYRHVTSILFMLVSTIAYSSADEKNTGRYVNAYKESLNGKTVTLHVTHITPVDRKNAPLGKKLLLAHTYDEKEHVRGGTITVLTTKTEADRLLKKFGTTPKVFGRKDKKAITKSLKGNVAIHGASSRPYLEMSRSSDTK